MSTAALAAKMAENNKLKAEMAQLQVKVAAADKRLAIEAQLVAMASDPNVPMEMRPLDTQDFLSKRAELEALPDLGAVTTAVKIASRRTFSPQVGDPATGQGSDSHLSTKSSKADRDFENAFLNTIER